MLFKIAFSFTDILWLRGTRSINVIPFYYDIDVGRFHMKEVIMNALVFIPLGLYLKMFHMSWKKTILYGCVFSFVLELCQFIFAIGASDITDIITNTLGTAVGVCLYALARKMFSDKQKTDKVINGIASIALLLFFSLALLLFIVN